MARVARTLDFPQFGAIFRIAAFCCTAADLRQPYYGLTEMIAKIEKIAENLKLESQRIRHDAVARVRAFVLETAGAVARAKEPVRYFGSTGLKINDISHKSMAKLLKAPTVHTPVLLS